MSARSLTRLVPVALLALALGATTGLADTAPEPVDLETAETDLVRLANSVKSKKSVNETIISDMEAVANAYHNLQRPEKPELEEVPENATEEEREELEAANKKAQDAFEADLRDFDKNLKNFRKDAEKLFIKALRLQKIRAQQQVNVRDDVNIRAVQLIGETGNPKLGKNIRKIVESVWMKAKYDVPTQLREDALGALGVLGDEDSLEWLTDEFIHTKENEAEWLTAAHKAMVMFKDVPGKLRYEVVANMVKTYSSTESAAKQAKVDPAVQAAKRLWDRIKNDVIKVIQYYAGAPQNEDGEALATMAEFQPWFRAHKNANRAPWKDEK